MDSQEENSSAIAPSLMVDLLSLDVAYNYFTTLRGPSHQLAVRMRIMRIIGPCISHS